MRKTRKIAIMSAVLILAVIHSVYAASFKFTPQTSAKTVKPGDTISIEFSVSDIEVGTEGINTVSTTIKYDEEVFETIKSSDFSGANNWSITYNDEEGERKGDILAVIISEGVTEDQLIGKLNLKVKENIEDQQTKIQFINVKTNDGQNEITNANKEITISIKAPEVQQQTQEPEKEPTTTPEPQKEPTTTQVPSTNNKTQVTSTSNQPAKQENVNKSLPKTGESTSKIIFALIIIVSIIAVIMYRKYRNLRGL